MLISQENISAQPPGRLIFALRLRGRAAERLAASHALRSAVVSAGAGIHKFTLPLSRPSQKCQGGHNVLARTLAGVRQTPRSQAIQRLLVEI